MSSPPRTARSIGLLYLLMGLPAPFNLIYIPTTFIARGDAAATARNITAHELTYRFGILSGLFSSVAFIFVVLSLYNLFRDVDRKHARLMVALVLVTVTLGIANLANEAAPLVLLGGRGYLTAFTRPQLEALALGFLSLRSSVLNLEMAFWGLWLFPFGVLVIKSGFMPRSIGVLLIVNCFAYLAVSLTGIIFPEHQALVDRIALPFYAAGELSVLIWFFAKGSRVRLPDSRPALMTA